MKVILNVYKKGADQPLVSRDMEDYDDFRTDGVKVFKTSVDALDYFVDLDSSSELRDKDHIYTLNLKLKAPNNWLDENDVLGVILDIVETHTDARIIEAECTEQSKITDYHKK